MDLKQFCLNRVCSGQSSTVDVDRRRGHLDRLSHQDVVMELLESQA